MLLFLPPVLPTLEVGKDSEEGKEDDREELEDNDILEVDKFSNVGLPPYSYVCAHNPKKQSEKNFSETGPFTPAFGREFRLASRNFRSRSGAAAL